LFIIPKSPPSSIPRVLHGDRFQQGPIFHIRLGHSSGDSWILPSLAALSRLNFQQSGNFWFFLPNCNARSSAGIPEVLRRPLLSALLLNNRRGFLSSPLFPTKGHTHPRRVGGTCAELLKMEIRIAPYPFSFFFVEDPFGRGVLRIFLLSRAALTLAEPVIWNLLLARNSRAPPSEDFLR